MPASSPFLAGRKQINYRIPAEIHVTVVYENLSAAVWASEALERMLRQIPNGAKPRFSPWRFGTLQNSEERARATAAAAHANVIVIAASSGAALLPGSVARWLEKCLAEPQRAITALAVLFDADDRADSADSPGLHAVRRLAEEAGCEFFVQSLAEPT